MWHAGRNMVIQQKSEYEYERRGGVEETVKKIVGMFGFKI